MDVTGDDGGGQPVPDRADRDRHDRKRADRQPFWDVTAVTSTVVTLLLVAAWRSNDLSTGLVSLAVALFGGLAAATTALAARRDRPWATIGRPVVGVTLVAAGLLLSARFRSWFDLDRGLWPAIVVAACGLVLGLPLLVAAVTDRLGLHVRPGRLAGVVLALGSAATFAATVHATLGAGLSEREAQRRMEVAGRYELTEVTDPGLVAVGELLPAPAMRCDRSTMSTTCRGGGRRPRPPAVLAPDAADRVRESLPEATVAEIPYRSLRVVGDPIVPRPTARTVADATPELLAALGLEHLRADVDAGRAVVLDASVRQEGGSIDVYRTSGDRERQSFDAVAVDGGVIPAALPAVLVPPEVGPTSVDRAPRGLVVGLPEPPGRTALDAVSTAATPPGGLDGEAGAAPVWAGTRPLELPFETGRLDAAGSVGLRDPAAVRDVAVVLALTAIAGLGYPRAHSPAAAGGGGPPAAAAGHAAASTATAMAGALVAGWTLTALSILSYNTFGRRGSGPQGTDLPGIPVTVPGGLLWIVIAAPVGAAGFAYLVGASRRPMSETP